MLCSLTFAIARLTGMRTTYYFKSKVIDRPYGRNLRNRRSRWARRCAPARSQPGCWRRRRRRRTSVRRRGAASKRRSSSEGRRSSSPVRRRLRRHRRRRRPRNLTPPCRTVNTFRVAFPVARRTRSLAHHALVPRDDFIVFYICRRCISKRAI